MGDLRPLSKWDDHLRAVCSLLSRGHSPSLFSPCISILRLRLWLLPNPIEHSQLLQQPGCVSCLTLQFEILAMQWFKILTVTSQLTNNWCTCWLDAMNEMRILQQWNLKCFRQEYQNAHAPLLADLAVGVSGFEFHVAQMRQVCALHAGLGEGMSSLPMQNSWRFGEMWRSFFGSAYFKDLQSLFEVEEHSWAINPNGTRAREYASTQKPGGREFCSHAELLNEIVFSVSSLSSRCLNL